MLRFAFHVLILLILIPLAFGVAALGGAALPGPVADRSGPGAVPVMLAYSPIHADLLIPLTPEVLAEFAFAVPAGVPLDDPRARWLVVGWGGADFYTTAASLADITPRAVWRGVTGDTSVLHLDVTGAIADDAPLQRLTLTEAGFAALRARLLDTFAQGAGGQPQSLALAGYSATDAFFSANGRFHIRRTCNAWMGALLREAGVAAGRWTPTPTALRLALRWHAAG